jgi:hypothetical protein
MDGFSPQDPRQCVASDDAFIAHVDQRVVVGLNRDADVEVSRPIGTHKQPISSASV